MRNEIKIRCSNVCRALGGKRETMLYWILGKAVPGVESDELTAMWIIAGRFISKIYYSTDI